MRFENTYKNQSYQTTHDGSSENGARNGFFFIVRSIFIFWMKSGATHDPGLSLVHLEMRYNTSGSFSDGTNQLVPRHASCGAHSRGREWTKSERCLETDHWVKNWTLEMIELTRGRHTEVRTLRRRRVREQTSPNRSRT